MKYKTHHGDVLDAICYRFYGTSRDHTERVLTANPGLAAYGPILPAGVIIELPEQTTSEPVKATVRLWD